MHTLPVRAVTVSSPALSAEMPAGAPPDLDVYGNPDRLDGVPLHIDCGRGDPFFPTVHDFVEKLEAAHIDPAPIASFGAGTHDGRYPWPGRVCATSTVRGPGW